jgi:hypothetical protein
MRFVCQMSWSLRLVQIYACRCLFFFHHLKPIVISTEATDGLTVCCIAKNFYSSHSTGNLLNRHMHMLMEPQTTVSGKAAAPPASCIRCF